jgi:hypothetical protein
MQNKAPSEASVMVVCMRIIGIGQVFVEIQAKSLESIAYIFIFVCILPGIMQTAVNAKSLWIRVWITQESTNDIP